MSAVRPGPPRWTSPAVAPDAEPPAPEQDVRRAWQDLRERGLTAPRPGEDRAGELAAVRAVAAEDLGLGRLLDGHRNAVQRLLEHRPEGVPPDEWEAIAADRLALGVWGADPGAGEGPPATLRRSGALVLDGVKTFCSGAGLLDRALVLVRRSPQDAPSTLALVDLTEPGTITVDRTWFASAAMSRSLSHRVVFDRAPVLAILGGPGCLAEEPWISGDALRTAATWAGGTDAVVDGLLEVLAGRDAGEADAAALSEVLRAREGAGLWLAHAAARLDPDGLDHGRAGPQAVRLARLEIAAGARRALDLTAELAGARGLVTGAPWARARADLDLLLRQHRLLPVAVQAGRAALDGRA